MTCGSRLGRAHRFAAAQAPRWHALCFLPWLSGCFYLGPMPDWEDNLPPRVLASNPADGEPIVLGPSGRQVMVVVTDPDPDDAVTITWWYSLDGYIGDAQPFPDGSAVNLPGDPELDGQELRCLLYDEAGHDVNLAWPLEVP